ncbi:cell division protein FtsZ [Serpentinimonas barnesii]|uniref:cell division protein FtsZ n=1 Tax=Serpentinimonas barnesii TaxID=1458427 RepID=UPI0034E22AEC
MITPLQAGLLLLGLALLVALLLYNLWNARRQRPRRPDAAASAPLPPGGPAEPGLRLDPVLGPLAQQPPAGGQDASAVPDLPKAVQPQQVLDARLDAIALLLSDQLVSGDAVLAALPVSRRIDGKPFYVEAQNTQSQQWELPRPGERYHTLRAGIQLVNRAGALNEIGFSQFIQRLDELADSLQLRPEYPDMMQEVARARTLDQFALAHDAQLSFYVRARRAAWSPGYLTQHAARVGFVPGLLPGRLVLPASTAGAAAVLVLQYETQAALADDPEQVVLNQFSIALDVPHVARSERPYVRLRESVQQLAHSMEGVVCDGAGTPLQGDAMDQIGAELEALCEALQARELAPGSVLARRLFS